MWKPPIDGYWTPGFQVSSKNFLDKNPKPKEDDGKRALDGNICCCGDSTRGIPSQSGTRHPGCVIADFERSTKWLISQE
jgi:hypothetical protein